MLYTLYNQPIRLNTHNFLLTQIVFSFGEQVNFLTRTTAVAILCIAIFLLSL